MVKNPQLLANLERDEAGRRGRELTYAQALRLFESLWDEARKLGAVNTDDPYFGLEADIEIARTLNALR